MLIQLTTEARQEIQKRFSEKGRDKDAIRVFIKGFG